jgi:hypothetical protein
MSPHALVHISYPVEEVVAVSHSYPMDVNSFDYLIQWGLTEFQRD